VLTPCSPSRGSRAHRVDPDLIVMDKPGEIPVNASPSAEHSGLR